MVHKIVNHYLFKNNMVIYIFFILLPRNQLQTTASAL